MHAVLVSGFPSTLDTVRCYTVCKHFQRIAQTAVMQTELIDKGSLAALLEELCFGGWFSLHCNFTDGDPIGLFHDALIGRPLTCYAGGDKRWNRPTFIDITEADAEAFRRLNPWDMLKVGPNGVRPRPQEPTQEWWAKLNAIFRAASSLKGRRWEWSELTSANG